MDINQILQLWLHYFRFIKYECGDNSSDILFSFLREMEEEEFSVNKVEEKVVEEVEVGVYESPKLNSIIDLPTFLATNQGLLLL